MISILALFLLYVCIVSSAANKISLCLFVDDDNLLITAVAVCPKSLKSIRGGTPYMCHSAPSAAAHQAARKLVAWSLKRGQRSGQEEAKMLGTQET